MKFFWLAYYFLKQLACGPARWAIFAWARIRVQGWHAFFPFYQRSRTVIIVRNDVLGDFLISLTAMQELSVHYGAQGYNVGLICGSANLELARQSGLFNVIIEADAGKLRNNRGAVLEAAKKIFALRPEVIVNIMSGDMGTNAALMAHCSGACRKVVLGWQFETRDLKYREKKLSFLKTLGCDSQRLMAYEKSMIVYDYAVRKLSFFRRFYYDTVVLRRSGEEIFDHEVRGARVLTGKSADEEIKVDRLNWLRGEELALPANYFVIVAGGSKPPCWWPAEKYAQAINAISADYPDMIPVFAGTKGESPVAESIIGMLNEPGRCLNLCSKTSILQLVTLMRRAKVVLGNDTGGTNLSSVMRVPTVCILSGNIPGYYFPNRFYDVTETIYSEGMPCLGCYNQCINPDLQQPRRCVTDIPVVTVVNAIKRMLK